MKILFTDGHKYRVTLHGGSYPSGERYSYFQVWELAGDDYNNWGDWKRVRAYQSFGWCKRRINSQNKPLSDKIATTDVNLSY